MKVFPAADLFPMLPADELQQLVDDIAAHGLREAVVVATIDGEEMLVDGRNRLAACKMAGVEPTLRRLNGEDPTAFVVSANINRRHMTKGQRAMAVAMIYPTPEKGGRGKKGAAQKAEVISGFSDRLVQQARTVLAHTPELARQVLDGLPLAEAYARSVEFKRYNDTDSVKLERLRKSAPDLAELVDDAKLPLSEAVATQSRREADAAAEEKSKRETYLRVTEAACSALGAFANPDFVAGLKDRLTDADFRSTFDGHLRRQDFDPDQFARAAKALKAIVADNPED